MSFGRFYLKIYKNQTFVRQNQGWFQEGCHKRVKNAYSSSPNSCYQKLGIDFDKAIAMLSLYYLMKTMASRFS